MIEEDQKFLKVAHEKYAQGIFSSQIYHTLVEFYRSYTESVAKNYSYNSDCTPLLLQFLDLVESQIKEPFQFCSFHQQVLEPFNYYQFGLEFLRPLIDKPHSKVYGIENLVEIEKRCALGENVFLLANHQSEADPQMISLLLEEQFPKLAQEMIFIAGNRVTSDPLAVPFSLGRNLICIYSRRYIEHPPEKKEEKLLHNQQAMMSLQSLLSEGGKCIYVAPSGGRDREAEDGSIQIAPFDAQSLEMMYLTGLRSKKKCYFHPLTLDTYSVMPPPSKINVHLGESRPVNFSPIHLSFGGEIDMEGLVKNEDNSLSKAEIRAKRAEIIWSLIDTEYKRIKSLEK